MAKRLILTILLVLAGVGALGMYGVVKYRRYQRALVYEEARNIKAAEISIRLQEGWNNKEIAAYLESQGVVKATDFLNAIKSFDASKYTSIPKEAYKDLQGFLYPDTYRLFESVKDRRKTSPKEAGDQIIEKLLLTFEAKLPKDAESLAAKQGLSLYETIILASIIEKETGRDAITQTQRQGLEEERRIVAGIFYNRLNSKVALESDATVNYVTGKSDPGVSIADTKIDSPYNTYKYRGLTPSPIANPSLSSIMAALKPADTDYFYFLHEQTNGKAIYSKTYDEHLANKRKYLD